MESYIKERAIEIANFIVDKKATITDAAKKFKVSRDIVYRDITTRMLEINPSLAEKVRCVLEDNINKVRNRTVKIFKVTNKIDGRKHIGLTTVDCFGRAFMQFISVLESNRHPDKKLQDDFNLHGIISFIFEPIKIVESISDAKNMVKRYIEEMNFDGSYNLYSNILLIFNINERIDIIRSYVDQRWLVLNITSDKELDDKKLDAYKIYKNEDKMELVDKFIELKIFSGVKVTYNRCIKFIEDVLGYQVKSGYFVINKHKSTCKKYRYKLIFNQDNNLTR